MAINTKCMLSIVRSMVYMYQSLTFHPSKDICVSSLDEEVDEKGVRRKEQVLGKGNTGSNLVLSSLS